MRVLYVEDDESVAKAVELMLTSEAYDCDTTYSGKGAIELAKANRYDIILLDLMLPDIDGYEVIKRLRATGVRTPFLLQTGLTDLDNQLAGRPFGVTEYLVKPFNKTDLIERIQNVLSRTKHGLIPDFISGPKAEGYTGTDRNERRKHKRFESGQAARILHKEGIDCLILNLSHGGAAIELPDPDMECPPAFDLELPSGAILRCRLCWRFQDKLGVKGEILESQAVGTATRKPPRAARAGTAALSKPVRAAESPCRADQEAEGPDRSVPPAPAATPEPPRPAARSADPEPSPATPRHPLEPPAPTEAVPAEEVPAEAAPVEEAPAEDAPAKDNRTADEDTFTIARGVRLRAETCECEEVLVSGHFEATVRARRLLVGTGGRFVGRAVVEHAEIAGDLEGELTATETLAIHGTGSVSGRTRYRDIVIEPGGRIAGEVQWSSDGAPAARQQHEQARPAAPAKDAAARA